MALGCLPLHRKLTGICSAHFIIFKTTNPNMATRGIEVKVRGKDISTQTYFEVLTILYFNNISGEG